VNPLRTWVLTAMVALVAASRLLPHPPNFAPLAAIGLFGAATFSGRWRGFVVPLLALFASDVLLHVTYRLGWQPFWGFYRGQWVVYACCVATVLIGGLLREKRTLPRVAAATLASSLLFFLVTNFVWFYGAGSLYPQTVEGLIECYGLALPFFRNSLLGDAFYSAALFGTLALAESSFPALRRSPSPQDAPAFARP
jgi:hypothetical protein